MTSRLPTTVFKRFSSTITVKPTPSKTHLHKPIPSTSFPEGYILTGIHAGIKKNASALDLAVILSTSPRPTSAAACFTRNAFKAAPVLVSEQVLEKNGGRARGIVVNSGCANAVTGKKGLENAWKMAKAADELLRMVSVESSQEQEVQHEDGSQTLVMSTGVIGQHVPIESILSALSSFKHPDSSTLFSSCFTAWENAAKAFMTTDTFPKLRARTFEIGGETYRLAGMDKGAGMIHPDMRPAKTSKFSSSGGLHATLLGCVLTDAPVSPRSLQSALTYAVDRSFNSISVDGEMSTNDTIIALANGAGAMDSDAPEIDEETDKESYRVFRDELTTFTQDLAQLVVRDGEGATKFVKVTVKGAPRYENAHAIASKISTSALVKTALYGEDANWGRILSATGSVPLSSPSAPTLEVDPTRVSVTFVPADGSEPLHVLTNGEPENVDEERAKKILEMEDINIEVDLKLGGESATYWTCDFSYEYVRINGDYRS